MIILIMTSLMHIVEQQEKQLEEELTLRAIRREKALIKSLPSIPKSTTGRLSYQFINKYASELSTIYGPRQFQKYPNQPISTDEAYEILSLIAKLPRADMITAYYEDVKKRLGKQYYDSIDFESNRAVHRRIQLNAYRGAANYEQFGCIAAAAELSRLIHRCMPSQKFHETRIRYLGDICGLIEYEQYTPKYIRSTTKLHPYWYTRLELTEKGERFIELYDDMVEIVINT